VKTITFFFLFFGGAGIARSAISAEHATDQEFEVLDRTAEK
jgi:hypothetical protein